MTTRRQSSDESEGSPVNFEDIISQYSQERCLPDTQPIEVESPHVVEDTTGVWGHLYALTPNFFSPIALIKVVIK